MAAVAPGEVHVPTTGAFLKAGRLEPGGKPARATLPVRNVTRGPVDVRLRAHVGNHDLDRAVHVQLRAGGETLASTTLAGLRRWTGSLHLNQAEERVVRVRAWIPEGTDDTVGRRVAVDLELRRRAHQGVAAMTALATPRRSRLRLRLIEPAMPVLRVLRSLLRFAAMTACGFAIGIGLALAVPLAFDAAGWWSSRAAWNPRSGPAT